MTATLPHVRLISAGLAALTLLGSVSISAAADRYRITSAEKAACTADAVRFCMDTYPDETRLLGCMKENRASLTSVCRVAFDAGVKRRRL